MFKISWQLLLACLQTQVQPQQVSTLAQQQHSWLEFRDLVYRHKVTGLVYRSLQQHASTVVPEAIMSELKKRFMTNTQSALSLTAELCQITASFEQSTIQSFVLKGLVLSKQLYDSPTLRESVDLDILVAQNKILDAHQVLLNHGYRCVIPSIPLSPKQSGYYFKYRKDFIYYHPIKGYWIELHWRFFDNPYVFASLKNNLPDSHETITLANRSFKVLSPTLNLLFLLTHGSKHAWAKLQWLCDIKQFLMNYPDINWSQLLKEAKQHGVTFCVIEGLMLCHRLLGSPITLEIITMAKSNKTIQFLLTTSTQTLTQVEANSFKSRMKILYRVFKFNSSLRYKFTFLKQVFGILPADWELVKLPDELFFLYYLLRPIIWLRKYCKKMTVRARQSL